jgi:hypothetical protein
MKRTRRLRPALLEVLEDRVALSTGMPMHVPAQVLAHPVSLHLVGIVSGRAVFAKLPPDVGKVIALTDGSGTVSPMGPVHASGGLRLTGFILNGHDQGTLVLRNKQGTVTLSLTRLPTGTPAPQGSDQWLFHIVAGTGAFRGATGTGTADFAFAGPIQVLGGGAGTARPFWLALNTALPPVMPL